MKGTAALFALAAAFVAFAPQDAQAQANGSKTIWDGVYTSEQADRGQRTTQQSCGACHSPSSEWGNSLFITAWSGQPILELHSHLRNTMPFDAPGNLTDQEYSDVIAYILSLNDAPPGEKELPGDSEGLAVIEVTRSSTP